MVNKGSSQGVVGKKLKIKKLKSNKLSYYQFINLPRDFSYFPQDDPVKYLEFVSGIRQFILNQLKERPLSDSQLASKLRRYNPEFANAMNYYFETIKKDEDILGRCKDALKILSEGIEIRMKGNRHYWGLTSKLDRGYS